MIIIVTYNKKRFTKLFYNEISGINYFGLQNNVFDNLVTFPLLVTIKSKFQFIEHFMA